MTHDGRFVWREQMRFTYATPPAFPLHHIDDALVREARRLLLEVVTCCPISAMIDRDARSLAFAVPMAKLCVDARLQKLSIERLIIAIKQAWGSLGDVRLRLGEVAPEILASAISVCIEQYYIDAKPGCAD
jgi:hypothetical protein